VASIQLTCWPQPLSLSLADFSVTGNILMTLRNLQTRSPYAGSLEVAFISLPEVEFQLGGLASVAELPGNFI
jgi:hypothetical protein